MILRICVEILKMQLKHKIISGKKLKKLLNNLLSNDTRYLKKYKYSVSQSLKAEEKNNWDDPRRITSNLMKLLVKHCIKVINVIQKNLNDKNIDINDIPTHLDEEIRKIYHEEEKYNLLYCDPLGSTINSLKRRCLQKNSYFRRYH